MRHLTDGELYSWYKLGQWPCGHGGEYILGPRGGMSRNIKCPTCGMQMNVVDPEAGYRMPFGQMLWEPEGYVPPKVPIMYRVLVALGLRSPWWE